MTKITEIIEIEIECSDEQIMGAIAQASQLDKVGIAQMLLPLALRQVFVNLPESSHVAIQIPNLNIQKNLEYRNG